VDEPQIQAAQDPPPQSFAAIGGDSGSSKSDWMPHLNPRSCVHPYIRLRSLKGSCYFQNAQFFPQGMNARLDGSHRNGFRFSDFGMSLPAQKAPDQTPGFGNASPQPMNVTSKDHAAAPFNA
jgi:hypothetical protein